MIDTDTIPAETKAERIAAFQKDLAMACAHLIAARDRVSPSAARAKGKLERMTIYCEMLIDRAAEELNRPA